MLCIYIYQYMLYTVCMKVCKSFRFTPEVADILNKQDNATKYIENLILGGSSNVNIGLQAANQIETIYAEILELKNIKKPVARDTSTSWEELNA